jgi:Flp pilus assembly protein TadG
MGMEVVRTSQASGARQGAALVYVLILWALLCAFASLAVDWGRVQGAKTSLQNAVDAAARAACYELPNGVTAARNAAVTIAAQNSADGSAVILDPNNDIQFGTWNPATKSFTKLTGSAEAGANTVRVLARRTAANGNAIPMSFSRILGRASCDVNVSSTTCLAGNEGAAAIIGLNYVNIQASSFTDSYDASKGPYVSAPPHHKGMVASNGNITLSQNAIIDGDARCGVGKSVILNNTASVTGLKAPLGAPLSYASVVLPASYVDLGDVNMSSGTVAIPGGTYLIHNLTLSGTAHIVWQGQTVLYIQNSYNVSGSVQIDTHQNLPKNRILNFLPTCTTATWTGTNVNIGEMYAPDTDFTIGGAVSNFGRITAKSITNSSSGGMHYDESLGAPGTSFVITSIKVVK